ncbi:MAG TPA: hypothetical protein VIK89_06235 [Cytophagaceae bacterium]
MLSKFKQQLMGIKKIAGVEAILLAEGKIVYNAIVLSIKKNLLTVEEKLSCVTNLIDLVKALPVGVPVTLAINGRGVMHKQVLLGSKTDSVSLIHSVLPNAKAQDYFIQHSVIENKDYVSVIRKNVAEEIFKSFKQQGVSVVSASLGAFALYNVFPLAKESMSVEQHIIGYMAALKDDVFENKNTVVIGGDSIELGWLVAYAMAFQQLVLQENKIVLEVAELAEEFKEVQHKALFRNAGIGVLVFFLLLLMINFFLFDAFKKEHEGLASREAMYKGMIAKVNQLQKEVDEKEAFLSTAGWFDNSRTSFYLDRIAASIPNSIRLTGLEVNPLNDHLSKSERKLIFTSRLIKIEGVCADPTQLNGWVKVLKEMAWAKDVKVDKYIYDNKEQKGNFYITIQL